MGFLSMKKTGIAAFVKDMRKHSRRLKLQAMDPANVEAGRRLEAAAALIERWGASHVAIMNLIQNNDYVHQETVDMAKQVAEILGARVTETTQEEGGSDG